MKRKKFEAVLDCLNCTTPASVYDPVSARIAEELGFEVAFLAGSSVSLQVLGAPDLVLVTLTELAEQTRRIVRACKLPLLVDADHGFGNALNVMRTVDELVGAGAAAVTIEDTALPATYGHSGSGDLIGIEEAIGKIRAACKAAEAAPIAVVARTDIAAVPLAEGLERIGVYSREPISAIFVSGVKCRSDIDAISNATDLSLILGAIPKALQDHDYLAARRVRLFNYGHQPLRAGIQAMLETMTAQKEGREAPVRLASSDTLERLAGTQYFREWAAAFLGGDLHPRR